MAGQMSYAAAEDATVFVSQVCSMGWSSLEDGVTYDE